MQDVIQSAIGGMNVTQTVEGLERYPVNIRYQRDYRNDLQAAAVALCPEIERALKLPQQPVCIMMTAYGDVDTAVQAMSRGAYWFLQKPVDLRQVELLLERGLKARSTEKEVAVLRTRLDRKFALGEVVGSSAALQRSIEQVRSVANPRLTSSQSARNCPCDSPAARDRHDCAALGCSQARQDEHCGDSFARRRQRKCSRL